MAIDVARILVSPIDTLAKTDIADYALDALARSRIRRVLLMGRRGPVQTAFTIKELREVTQLAGCVTRIDSDDMRDGLSPVSLAELTGNRALSRKLDLIKTIPTAAAGAPADTASNKLLHFRFFSAPHAFHPHPTQSDRIGSVSFERYIAPLRPADADRRSY